MLAKKTTAHISTPPNTLHQESGIFLLQKLDSLLPCSPEGLDLCIRLEILNEVAKRDILHHHLLSKLETK
jgi:hypothetical protein